ncbi:MAG: fimbrillin family protein [Parabacteroides sp.]|nr:fimbrillin family protein [Parabacteroides sp.]
MKRSNLQITLLCLAALTATSCSNENDPLDKGGNGTGNNEPVELGITAAGVSLTKSVIDGNNDATQTGTEGNLLKEIMVLAAGESGVTDYGSGNEKAIYKYTGGDGTGSWAQEGNDHIYLTAKKAAIYAYHPVYQFDENGNKGSAISITGNVGPDATISITLFAGGTGTSGSPTQLVNSTITDDGTSTGILSAPGEVDYLYEGSSSRPTASNGKTDQSITSSVALEMKHALSLVSFKIYKDNSTYKGPAKLTKIVLRNKSTATTTTLKTSSNATMKIGSGEITRGTESDATFTRVIKGSDSNGDQGADIKESSGARTYSILVFPDASTVAKNEVEDVFTIDGADYTVALATDAQSGNQKQWVAGTNNIYGIKLSGTGLGITSVKVAAWSSNPVGSDLEAK